MNLRKFANIFKRNTKINENIEVQAYRFDIFLVIVIFIVIITPFVIAYINKVEAEHRLINLYVSSGFEELFGAEMAENLLFEYNEANPGIRVRLFAQDDKIPADKEPDIIIFDDKNTINLAVLDLYLGAETEPDAESGIIATTGIPLVNFMDVLFYNIDALSAAGFDRPPRTFGQYQTYSKTAADLGYYCDDIIAPENNRPWNRKLEDFAKGTAAMIVASTREIPSLRESMGDDIFNITSIPYASNGTVGRYDINLTGIYAGICVNSAYMDEAWRFIEFLAEYRAVFCEMFKAVPGTTSDVIPGDYVKDDPFYSKAWDIFEYNRTEGLQN